MIKIFLIGNVGSDPETKQTQSSTMTSFSLAVNETKKKGETIEKKTNWFRIVHFGKGAEFSKKYVKKGMKIHVEGKIEISIYQDKDGIQRESTSVIAENINIFDKKTTNEEPFNY